MINTDRKVTGYKINARTSEALLYTIDKCAEKKIRETKTFIIATDNIKYLGTTLTKQVKDWYDNNYKTLKKEIKE